ncbi:MAG: hypothetical protein IJZ80_01355 [Clostridia bacterium]|nr:hypothetical protein [Clostridia bacterium]
MKKYYNPEIEVVLLKNEDILTASLTAAGEFAWGAVEDGNVWDWES